MTEYYEDPKHPWRFWPVGVKPDWKLTPDELRARRETQDQYQRHVMDQIAESRKKWTTMDA